MDNVRMYGGAPYQVALVHGGPGAAGSLAGLAQLLSGEHGVLEPLQTASSLEGQVAELCQVLRRHGELPVTLVGHSWGAWLAYLVAAKNPDLVNKLILVSSGPFAQNYVQAVGQTRTNRMNAAEQAQFEQLLKQFASADSEQRNSAFACLGKLMDKVDTYAAIAEDHQANPVKVDFDIYQSVWPQAAALRKSGELLAHADELKCPVVVFHGDYDPHPVAGVTEPLSRRLKDFRHFLLEKCGHTPWEEQYARDRFLELISAELRVSG